MFNMYFRTENVAQTYNNLKKFTMLKQYLHIFVTIYT